MLWLTSSSITGEIAYFAYRLRTSPASARSPRPIGHGAQHDGIAGDEKEIMERSDKKKPAEPKQVRANEFLMGLERGTQLLVMQHQRHLHGTENNNEPAHDEAGVIENIGRFPEKSREQRRPDNQRAHDGHD